MGFSRYTLILAAWSVALTAGQTNPCPPPGTISPCTCDYSGINCMKAKTTESLQKTFGVAGPNEHKGLWIQRTPVPSLPAGVFGNFKFVKAYIDLNKNLTSFSLEALANSKDTLQELSLFGNDLSRIDYDSLAMFASLETLNLAQNKITSIPMDAFKNSNLETLVLSKNPIEKIGAFAFAGLPQLDTLKMGDTRIKSLDANSMSIFPHNPELKIHIESGRIESIHPKAFEKTFPLELKLSYNNLNTFPENIFHPIIIGALQNVRKGIAHNLPKVLTRGNRFTCRGCDFKWLLRLSSNMAMQMILSDFSCMDGTRLYNLTSSVIGC